MGTAYNWDSFNKFRYMDFTILDILKALISRGFLKFTVYKLNILLMVLIFFHEINSVMMSLKHEFQNVNKTTRKNTSDAFSI